MKQVLKKKKNTLSINLKTFWMRNLASKLFPVRMFRQQISKLRERMKDGFLLTKKKTNGQKSQCSEFLPTLKNPKVHFSKLPWRKQVYLAAQPEKALGILTIEVIPEKVLKDLDPLVPTDPLITTILQVLSVMRLRSNLRGGSKSCLIGFNYYLYRCLKHITRVTFDYYNTTKIQNHRQYNAPIFSKIDEYFREIEHNLGQIPVHPYVALTLEEIRLAIIVLREESNNYLKSNELHQAIFSDLNHLIYKLEDRGKELSK